MDKPSQVFNTDESGMPLDPPPLKVVVPRGAKHSQTVAVLACCRVRNPAICNFRSQNTETRVDLGGSSWDNVWTFQQWLD